MAESLPIAKNDSLQDGQVLHIARIPLSECGLGNGRFADEFNQMLFLIFSMLIWRHQTDTLRCRCPAAALIPALKLSPTAAP